MRNVHEQRSFVKANGNDVRSETRMKTVLVNNFRETVSMDNRWKWVYLWGDTISMFFGFDRKKKDARKNSVSAFFASRISWV